MPAPLSPDPDRFEAWWRGGTEAELREILMRWWDPIGVASEPAAADEYDRYLLGVVGLLRSGATAQDVAARLREIERTEMGLSTPSSGARTLAAGRRIHAWHAGASPPQRVPAPGWHADADPTSTEAIEAWAEARVDELVAEGYAALRARGHDVAFVDVAGLEAEIAVEANLYAQECVDVRVTVWRPRPPRTFPRRLLPRWRSSLVVASATLAPDGVLVEAEVDGERIPQGR